MFQLRKELFDHPSDCVPTVVRNILQLIPRTQLRQILDDLLFFLDGSRLPEDALKVQHFWVVLQGVQQDVQRDRESIFV